MVKKEAVDKDDLTKEEYKLRRHPNDIKCKAKRMEVVEKLLRAKKKSREKSRKERQKERNSLGDEAPPKQVPRTIESMRRQDETVVDTNDEEFTDEINADEFATYFNGKPPKVCITTNRNGHKKASPFAKLFTKILPDCEYFHRREYNLKEIIGYLNNKDYTDLIVVNETRDELIISHLPKGPTARFKISSILMPEEIAGVGVWTDHKAELIINNFSTRLGHTVGRLFASLFPQDPNFIGRRVCTLHNQRDYIFFRQHRYMFESTKEVNMQELGPRFTLKLKSLQLGSLDRETGEYLHLHKARMDIDRKKFVL
eukprot:gene1927-2362_t